MTKLQPILAAARAPRKKSLKTKIADALKGARAGGMVNPQVRIAGDEITVFEAVAAPQSAYDRWKGQA